MTVPNTSQDNRVVERGFTIVRNRAIAMMNDLDQDIDLKEKLWAEALTTSTYLVNITECSTNWMESNHRKMFGEKAIILFFTVLDGCRHILMIGIKDTACLWVYTL
eukprot:197285_1